MKGDSIMPNTHPEYDLVTEKPMLYGGLVYTARRNPDEARWQVFTEKGFAPVGYLEAVHQPTETTINNGWQIAVYDRHNQPLGELRKRAPGTVPAVNSYVYALALLDRAEGGIA